MVNIVGFLQGIRESDDYWTKKSAEARDEYNRFVQSNPDSTVADRIERQKLLGGDMDYLRRLMPDEGNVTRNVGVQTQLRTDQQDQRNRAAASAGYAAARFKEWEAGADNRKKLQELQLSNATTGVQLAKRKEVLDRLVLEEGATFEDYTTLMNEKGIFPSFGAEVLSLNRNQFDKQMQDRKNTIELERQRLQGQITANDMKISEGSIQPLLSLFETGYIDGNTPPDAVKAEYIKLNPDFGKLAPAAQNSALFQAQRIYEETVAEKITRSVAAWADKSTGSNADPSQWGGEGQFGSEFDLTKLSERNKNLLTNLKNQASNTARNNEEREVKLLFSQRVAGANSEEDIEAIKKGLEAEYPLLSSAAIQRAFDSSGAVEIRVKTGLVTERQVAVNATTTELRAQIASGNFANKADLDSAIENAFGALTSSNIPAELITKAEKELRAAFDNNLRLLASEADAKEAQAANLATIKDNSAVVSSGMDAQSSQTSIEAVGAIIANDFGLTKDGEIKELKQPLVRTFNQVEQLATQLGIPVNKEFIEATLRYIFDGSSSGGLEAFGSVGASETVILDAIQANLRYTHSVSPSMVSFMTALGDQPLSSMAGKPRERSDYRDYWNTTGKPTYYSGKTDVVYVGNPRHGVREPTLVTEIEQVEQDAAAGVGISNNTVTEASAMINSIQSTADTWREMYSGEDAIRPFAEAEKQEFAASRESILRGIKEQTASLRESISQSRNQLGMLERQMKTGSFYQSQLSGNNEGVGRYILAHMTTLKDNIVRFDGMVKRLGSINDVLKDTEMVLTPTDVSQITEQYEVPQPTNTQELEGKRFEIQLRAITVLVDSVMKQPNPTTAGIHARIRERRENLVDLMTKQGMEDGLPSLLQIYDDATKVALSRADYMTIEAEERNAANPQ